MRLVDAQFLETPWYGARQMARHLPRESTVVGRKRIRRLMAKMGRAPIYQRPRTTVPNPEHRIFPSLLRDLVIDRPNQVAPVVLALKASENMQSHENHMALYWKLARMTREQGEAWLAEQPERTLRMEARLWHIEDAKRRKQSLADGRPTVPRLRPRMPARPPLQATSFC